MMTLDDYILNHIEPEATTFTAFGAPPTSTPFMDAW